MRALPGAEGAPIDGHFLRVIDHDLDGIRRFIVVKDVEIKTDGRRRFNFDDKEGERSVSCSEGGGGCECAEDKSPSPGPRQGGRRGRASRGGRGSYKSHGSRARGRELRGQGERT